MQRITIGDCFDHAAHRAPRREALVFRAAGVRWSYRDTLTRVQRLAKGLIGLGVEPGDHVAVWATNRPEWVLLQLATAKVGAALVPIDPAERPEDVAYILAQSDATTLFLVARAGDSDQLALVADLCPELRDARPGRFSSRTFPALKRIALFDDRGAPGLLAWSAVLAAGAGITDHLLRRRQEGVDTRDTALVLFTAATSGPAKGAELAHAALVNAAWYAGECMRLTARDRLCVPVPFHDGLGAVLGTVAAVCRGATLIVPAEEFDAEETLATVAAERCTALHGRPMMFAAELAQRRFHDYDLTSLRTGIIGGAAAPADLVAQVVRRMHAREITVAYGPPEASSIVTQTRTEDPLELRASTVGRALPFVEVKIADLDGRGEVARDEQGELCCRGYPVMRGYYKMPEATAAVLGGDGWLHTGDLAVMDEHGYCRITGRVADLVRRGGERVDTSEVEALLRSHPAVRDARVFAVGDPRIGEDLAAWIRLREGAMATPEELRDFCRARVPSVKTPRHVRLVDAYPTTGAGKVQTFKMRRAMADELRLRRAT